MSYGASYTKVASDEFEQFVRDVTAGASSTTAVYGDSSVTLTCIFRGDALDATTWSKGGVNGDLASGEGTYTVKAGTYDAYVRTDELVILEVKSADVGTYTCKAAYTTGKTETSVSQAVVILGLHLNLMIFCLFHPKWSYCVKFIINYITAPLNEYVKHSHYEESNLYQLYFLIRSKQPGFLEYKRCCLCCVHTDLHTQVTRLNF